MDYSRYQKANKLHQNNIPLILFVEDDPDNRFLLQCTISLFGWKYIAAENAFDAVSIAVNKHPYLILLDIVLPGINGLQIASILQSNNLTWNIPLIAITGLTRNIEQKLIFAVGFNDYLCKPFFLEDLQTVIARNLKLNPVLDRS